MFSVVDFLCNDPFIMRDQNKLKCFKFLTKTTVLNSRLLDIYYIML